jgi:hypothetical protein
MQVASAGGGYLTAANREQALSALGKKPHRSDPGVSRSSEEARTKLRKRWREVIQRGWLGGEWLQNLPFTIAQQHNKSAASDFIFQPSSDLAVLCLSFTITLKHILPLFAPRWRIL